MCFIAVDDQRKSINDMQTWISALHQNRHALLDLFNEWDVNGDGAISKKEFRKGIEALNIGAPISEVNALFDSYDADRSGTIELSEMMRKMDQSTRRSKSKIDVRHSQSTQRQSTVAGDSCIASVRLSTEKCNGSHLPAIDVERPPEGGQDPPVEAIVAPSSVMVEGEGEDEPEEQKDGRRAFRREESGISDLPSLPGVPRSPFRARVMSGPLPERASVDAMANEAPASASPPSSPTVPRSPSRTSRRLTRQLPAQAFASASSKMAHMASKPVVAAKSAANVLSTQQQVEAKTREIRLRMMASTTEELDKSRMWAFKTYYLFPFLIRLRHLDHLSRLVFPTAYTIYLLSHLAQVDFGATQWELLDQHYCRHAGAF